MGSESTQDLKAQEWSMAINNQEWPTSLDHEFDQRKSPTSLTHEFHPREWATSFTHENNPRVWPMTMTHENDPQGPRDTLHLAHSSLKQILLKHCLNVNYVTIYRTQCLWIVSLNVLPTSCFHNNWQEKKQKISDFKNETTQN